MKELHFTTYVLGSRAAYRLKTRRVTQTLRSRGSSIVKAGVRAGDEVLIALDGNDLGTVRVTSVDRVTFKQVFLDDAQRGGFETLDDLASALRRAGYRFKSLKEYKLVKIRFEWPVGSHVVRTTALCPT